MDTRLEDFVSYCARMDFGAVNLSEGEKEFYRQFNKENILLCNSLPESIQEETKRFLKRYSGIEEDTQDDRSDFFKNYYAPAWSIIYWLADSPLDGNDLSKGDIKNAITAHSMALTLHSLDDHLNDGQIPASHLTVLLRSQSWLVMTTAFDRLAGRVNGAKEIVRNFINDYYSGICGQETMGSLDTYCDLFSKQMATWLIVPVLLAGKIIKNREFQDRVQSAYESFGIAWRLLDDIQDIFKDMKKGAHSGIYVCLPEDIKTLWDKNPEEGLGNETDSVILDYILTHGLVDRVKERACREMESAASTVEEYNIKGLADEFRSLVRPFKTGSEYSGKVNVEEENRPDKGKKILSIEVTTHCNSACTHCFVRAGLTEPSSLSLDVVKAVISEGRGLDYRNLHITGGEPLLWEGLFDALDYAFDQGYTSVFLNTNGSLLTEKVAARLAAYKGVSVSVSLEGREGLHDSVRGKGAYRRTVSGIEKALDAGIGLITYTTARRNLLPDLPEFIDEAYKTFPGIQHMTLIQLIRVKDDVFDLSQELLDPHDFLTLVKMVSLLNVFGYKVGILNNPLADVASKKLGIWGTPKSAPLHRDGDLIVMADRSITPAHSTNHSLGRYEAGMIERVLLCDEYLTAVAPDKKTCPSCSYYALCAENGMARPSQWYRDLDTEVPYCRRVLNTAVL